MFEHKYTKVTESNIEATLKEQEANGYELVAVTQTLSALGDRALNLFFKKPIGTPIKVVSNQNPNKVAKKVAKKVAEVLREIPNHQKPESEG